MAEMNAEYWKEELDKFREKTAAFYAGEINVKEYKGFSGFYGSYAQRGGKAGMLRLRMPAGRITKERLQFVAESIQKYQVQRVHFTTCQTIQLHDLTPEVVCELVSEALDAGIVTMGGGGDFPRNVMCSPLSGVEQGEYFDVLPWAEAAGDFLLGLIKQKKMPRKLKVCFSNSPANLTHATYRDLGFAAREDGKFDVYSAGGLGNHPCFGVKVAEAVEPKDILYYIKAMWLTFLAYGNYENRSKARTRYMQEALGGAAEYKKAFLEKLDEVKKGGEDLTVAVSEERITKKPDGAAPDDNRVIQQKQDGLYTVLWHPIGGQPQPQELVKLYQVISPMEETELRLAPDETVYIINLTGAEAAKVLEATEDGARSLFEMSVSCIGAGICQVGLRDSQTLLQNCVDAVRKAGIPEHALPQIHISGCLSSCGTHQTGTIGFRGAVKLVDKKPNPAFILCVNGEERQGEEAMGRELGAILESEIPQFLVELGQAVAESGMDFAEWKKKNPDGLEQLAEKYIA